MIVENFKATMQNAGIEAPGEIIADGALHRFTVAGDRARSDNGWYVIHADNPAAGAFGCWKRGISEKWCSKSLQAMTAQEKVEYARRMDGIHRQKDEELQRIRANCRKKAGALWQASCDVESDHPYIVAKQIQPYGSKQLKDSLIVPVRDVAGTLHGLQFIRPDGEKKFMTGTAVSGCYFSIGKPEGKILIAEGFATGATLHEMTGYAVAIAFNAGNLKPVAEALRAKLPDMELIVCADDDHMTGGNPGLTKATEAAQAVNGRLVIPSFPDNRVTKDTDFNDLYCLAGPAAVRQCIEKATTPVSNVDEAGKVSCNDQESIFDKDISRLAALSPLEYDRLRKTQAKALGVRLGTLDAAVKTARNDEGELLPFMEVELWPDPIDPSHLLSDISSTIQRFIVCEDDVSHAVALWISMTWLIDIVQVAPLAIITAPEKRCGKSQLLHLLGLLSARSIMASNITPAALFRAIEAWQPTLLIDEADSFLRDNEELRGILNSGHTRDSAYVIRTVGDNFTPTRFNTWGAKALAGIGHVADTLMDRAIIFELRRKLPHEEVDRIRYADPNLFCDLRAKLARFAKDYGEEVRHARPPLPSSLNDRAQDNWEPLLAVAMTAGDEWLQTGTAAALKLSCSEKAAQTIGIELLSDIRDIFEERKTDRIGTAELIRSLCEDDEKAWATYNKGFQIKPRQVANKLKGYGIQSKTIRLGFDTMKGYEKGQFEEAFSRYLSSVPPEIIRHTSQSSAVLSMRVPDEKLQAEQESLESQDEPQAKCDLLRMKEERDGCVTEKETLKAALTLDCNVVTDRTSLPDENNKYDLSENELAEVNIL